MTGKPSIIFLSSTMCWYPYIPSFTWRRSTEKISNIPLFELRKICISVLFIFVMAIRWVFMSICIYKAILQTQDISLAQSYNLFISAIYFTLVCSHALFKIQKKNSFYEKNLQIILMVFKSHYKAENVVTESWYHKVFLTRLEFDLRTFRYANVCSNHWAIQTTFRCDFFIVFMLVVNYWLELKTFEKNVKNVFL